jgi:DNA-directed RNA polymerase specialized sigma24 family protein
MSDIHTPPPPDEALDRLYRTHSSSIYRYALALVGNHVDAEDLTQTTFLNAYRALTHGQIPLAPQAWLRQITSNAYATTHAGPVRCSFTTIRSPPRLSTLFCFSRSFAQALKR